MRTGTGPPVLLNWNCHSPIADRKEEENPVIWEIYKYLRLDVKWLSTKPNKLRKYFPSELESLDIPDDLVDHTEVGFDIPTQRFGHTVSSTAPKYIGNQLVRRCSVCLLLKAESEYRASLSNDCQHSSRTVCDNCVYYNIVMLLGNCISNPIGCPELICAGRLSAEDVRQILTYHNNMALLNKYDTYLTSVLMEKMSGFVWCAHGCGSGQLHLSLTPKVICVVCNRSTCFFHHVPWHEGLTCEEYQIFGASNEAVTLKYLKTFAKECPQCQVNIEKNEGCDHMICTQCSTEFCWNCLAKFGPARGLSACPHKTNCIHFRTRPIAREQPVRQPNRRLRLPCCTLF